MNPRRYPRMLRDVFTSRIRYDWGSKDLVDAMLDHWFPQRVIYTDPPWYVRLFRKMRGKT